MSEIITVEMLDKRVSFLQTTIEKLTELVTGQQSEPTYSVKQVAIKLGIKPGGVLYHIREGNIKTTGNRKRFLKIKESDLNTYIATLTNMEAKD